MIPPLASLTTKESKMPFIKVCGLTDPANIDEVLALGIHYVGFIFYPSSARFVGEIDPDYLRSIKTAKKTAVFVNASFDEIAPIVNKFQFDAVQLHGDESPHLCSQVQDLGVQTIKAFGVNSSFNFNILEPYLKVVDYFLFDTKTPLYGGSGKAFDWSVLEHYPYPIPYFLSGGIGPENISATYEFKDERLFALDLNSRFENSPGIKNIELLKQVLKA